MFVESSRYIADWGDTDSHLCNFAALAYSALVTQRTQMHSLHESPKECVRSKDILPSAWHLCTSLTQP
ncbi:hypothetical protein CBOM_08070 [Ceraceosorus bombacis]|uniref:Uncharacterized protein n=1 Tax=Ceraceosorus bombacis TaxID=401625 RepID=A0A0P1BSU2_9BASI|nr:hypothetical protein CBOM_08070 [Ceraceosorus bombacis]